MVNKLLVPVLAFIIITLGVVVFNSQDVSADGAVIPGGSGGSCSGGCGGAPYTSNGYGWFRFRTNTSGPRDFADGNTWANVRNICTSTGNDEVIAFIIERPDENPYNAKVYKYEAGDYGSYYHYKGNNGGDWLSYGAAKARFDSIDASLKSGYSWGNNVAAFCYSDNPVWTTSVSSTVSKTLAKPGDLVTWTHRITNNGPAKTNKTITYSKAINSIFSDNHTLPSGSAKNATGSFTSTANITQDDVDTTLCRATSAIPSSHTSNNRITSANACVTVPYDWSAETTAAVTRVTKSNAQVSPSLSVAEPGGVVTWTHTVRLNGPTKTNANVVYSRVNGEGLTPGTVQLGTFPTGTLPGADDTHTSSTIITQDQVDGSVCRLTRATPRNQAGGNANADSPYACVSVPYNYTLTPNATSASSKAVEGGSDVAVDLSMSNTGPTKSKPSQWVVTQLEVAPGPGSAIPNSGGGNSPTDPCGTYFTNGSTTCEIIGSGTSVFGTSGSVISGDLLNNITRELEDLPIGTRVCFALSVKPRSSASNDWAHSAPVCVTVGKKPKVQVIGGDLAAGVENPAGSNIITSTTVKKISGQSRTFGSWTEYGVLTNGIVTGMGSGSGFNNGSVSGEECSTSLLTFTNASDGFCTQSDVKGNYTLANKLPDVAAAFPITSSTPTFSNLSDAEDRQVVTATNAITIGGGTIEKGDWLVINAEDQTVTITGNINYTSDTLNSVRDIPQIVIIANSINIRSGVTNIDAWLIATGEDGTINTCSNYDPEEPLTYEMCDQKLTVNGPVVAKSLYLRRTAGAGTGSSAGDPAEVFNLRPDAYLWSATQALEAGRIQSVYSTELPPRF